MTKIIFFLLQTKKKKNEIGWCTFRRCKSTLGARAKRENGAGRKKTDSFSVQQANEGKCTD